MKGSLESVRKCTLNNDLSMNLLSIKNELSIISVLNSLVFSAPECLFVSFVPDKIQELSTTRGSIHSGPFVRSHAHTAAARKQVLLHGYSSSAYTKTLTRARTHTFAHAQTSASDSVGNPGRERAAKAREAITGGDIYIGIYWRYILSFVFGFCLYTILYVLDSPLYCPPALTNWGGGGGQQ